MDNSLINSGDKDILNKISKINSMKQFSEKEIDIDFNISTKVSVNTFQSKIADFNHENMFLCKPLKLENSQYEMLIDNKKNNSINLNLIIPKDQTQIGHWYKAFVGIVKNGNVAKFYELEDTRESKDFFYLKGSIPWEKNSVSLFKIFLTSELISK